jgi:hypothetical protein
MDEVCPGIIHVDVCRCPICFSRLPNRTEEELYLPVSEDIQK